MWCFVFFPLQSPCTTAPWGERTVVSVRTPTQSTNVCGVPSRRRACTRCCASPTSKDSMILPTQSAPIPRSLMWVVTMLSSLLFVFNFELEWCIKDVWLAVKRHWICWLDYWFWSPFWLCSVFFFLSMWESASPSGCVELICSTLDWINFYFDSLNCQDLIVIDKNPSVVVLMSINRGYDHT